MKIKLNLTYHHKFPILPRIKAADITGDVEVKVLLDNISCVDKKAKSEIKSLLEGLFEKGIRGTITIDDEIIEIANPNLEVLEEKLTKASQEEDHDQ